MQGNKKKSSEYLWFTKLIFEWKIVTKNNKLQRQNFFFFFFLATSNEKQNMQNSVTEDGNSCSCSPKCH